MSFSDDIKKFNRMYKMPVNITPTLDVGVPLLKRLKDFKSIVGKELNEIDDIIEMAVSMEEEPNHFDNPKRKLLVMVNLADLLGDIQVYCASEMAKFGLPQDEVLSVIMRSNFSKMGADGKPEYDDEGKLKKGPNYRKPEPEIEAVLALKLRAAEGHKVADALLAADRERKVEFERQRGMSKNFSSAYGSGPAIGAAAADPLARTLEEFQAIVNQGSVSGSGGGGAGYASDVDRPAVQSLSHDESLDL